MKLLSKIAKIYSDFDNASDHIKTHTSKKKKRIKHMKKESERPTTAQQWKKDSNGNIIISYDNEKQQFIEPYWDQYDDNEPTLNPIEIIDNRVIGYDVEKLFNEARQYVTVIHKYEIDHELSEILKDYITYKRDVVPKLDDYKKYYTIYQQANDSVTKQLMAIDAEAQAKIKLLDQLNDSTKSKAEIIAVTDQLKAKDDAKQLINKLHNTLGNKYIEPTVLPTVEIETTKKPNLQQLMRDENTTAKNTIKRVKRDLAKPTIDETKEAKNTINEFTKQIKD